jgi:hypothetical protein
MSDRLEQETPVKLIVIRVCIRSFLSQKLVGWAVQIRVALKQALGGLVCGWPNSKVNIESGIFYFHSTPAISSHSACPPGTTRVIAMSPSALSAGSE